MSALEQLQRKFYCKFLTIYRLFSFDNRIISGCIHDDNKNMNNMIKIRNTVDYKNKRKKGMTFRRPFFAYFYSQLHEQ